MLPYVKGNASQRQENARIPELSIGFDRKQGCDGQGRAELETARPGLYSPASRKKCARLTRLVAQSSWSSPWMVTHHIFGGCYWLSQANDLPSTYSYNKYYGKSSLPFNLCKKVIRSQGGETECM